MILPSMAWEQYTEMPAAHIFVSFYSRASFCQILIAVVITAAIHIAIHDGTVVIEAIAKPFCITPRIACTCFLIPRFGAGGRQIEGTFA